MKYPGCTIILLFVSLFSSGCNNKHEIPTDSINLLDWSLKRPVLIMEEQGGWQWFRSENFPLSDSDISVRLARGEKAVQVSDLKKRNTSLPTTWFIHATDPIPEILSVFSIHGDTLFFDDYKLDLSGKYFFTIIHDKNSSSFHEIIFSGVNARTEEFVDFINKTLFITDPWFLYDRSVLKVSPLKTTYTDKEAYPHFPEGSHHKEWVDKIRNSPMPEVMGEAFETYLNIKSLPVVSGDICTFFWFEETGDKPVFILSDRTGWTAGAHNQMVRIPGTHIHFLQTDLHAESRIEYIIRWNDRLFRDYLNPKYTGNGYFSHSLCLMPEYESVPEVEKVPLYYQSEYDEYVSEKGNKVILLLPPGYSFSSSRYRTLYLINGAPHESVIRTIMDNLMLSGQISPMITVLSDGDNVNDLIRDVDKRYRSHPDAAFRYLAGWGGQTKFILFDSKIVQNYFLISPMDLDESFHSIHDKMSVNLSWGLYDLPQVHNVIKTRIESLKQGNVKKHTFPGGHHAIEWYGELVKLIIDNSKTGSRRMKSEE